MVALKYRRERRRASKKQKQADKLLEIQSHMIYKRKIKEQEQELEILRQRLKEAVKTVEENKNACPGK